MSENIKITIVTASMGAGGAERVIAQLLNEWDKVNCELSLILLEKAEKFYALPERVKVFEIGNLSKNKIKNKIKKYNCVKKTVEALNPDIVLSMPEEIGIYVLWGMRKTKIPVVVSERNNPWVMPNKKITRWMRKLMYPHAKGLIFQTDKAASFFSEKIRNKSIVLPNPLDLSRIPAVWEGERDKVIVSAGRLEPQKNFTLLIEAFSVFYETHKDYKLIVYGEGSERKKLEDSVSIKGLQDSISFPGVSKNLLIDIRKASMFVLSSDYEGVPNVLIEAMATGIPCISTDCEPGGAASIIENGVNGILVPIGNISKMADSMNELANHTDIAKNLSNNALSTKEKYDSNNVALRWLDYLKSVSR